MSVINRSNFANEMSGVGLQIVDFIDQGLAIYTPGIYEILTKTSGEGAQRNYEAMSTGGELKKTDEGQSAFELNRGIGYLTQVRYTKYTGSLSVTDENVDDREFSAIFDEAKQLGRNANYSIDRSGVQILNGGFATTKTVNGYDITLYGDGVPTFSTVHPTKFAGTSNQSNASSTGAVLSIDNYETAYLSLLGQKTDDGFPIGYTGMPTLSVPSALVREARELFETERTPYNNNNTINVYKGAVNIMSTLHLDATNGGSNTAWFLTTPNMDKLYMEMRKEPTIEMERALKSGVTTFVVSARWAPWVGDWRNKYASKGDGQAYSS